MDGWGIGPAVACNDRAEDAVFAGEGNVESLVGRSPGPNRIFTLYVATIGRSLIRLAGTDPTANPGPFEG